ncbi:putative vacuolar ATP synthase [Paratrimastix pyriformis]|uniref:V-type proton ATPase subunit F n=1 Tax=Paratrimastix pyriformis TaxID=342808 RepID=A0ABQ8UA00_9EUKA|nr:putative vacuolar ATP synthase [Paratrimastix pyriformis]
MSKQAIRSGNLLIAVIGEPDTVTGMLLAGMGNLDAQRNSNFLVVEQNTPRDVIEEAFHRFTRRNDIGILLINQHIADLIRPLLDDYDQNVPTILEIPGVHTPYDSSKDAILKRAHRLTSSAHER